MEALKLMASPTATVLRSNNPITIPSSEIVPGDIVILEAGRIVPADLRLADTAQLKIEEAALTGESIPIEKSTAQIHDEMIPLGDRKNIAYKGTIVRYGRGKGITVATGMETELGRIATMLQAEEEVKTPLQKRLAVVGKRLAIAALGICAIVFAVGIMRGEPPVLMLLTAISLAVAAIPEALPAVVTISLALGARKLVKQNALIRKLPAVETLGSVTYICSDKTGTLTLNKMAVEEIYVDGQLVRRDHGVSIEGVNQHAESPLQILFKAMALSNDVVREKEGRLIGDPTEVALYRFAEEAGSKKKPLLEKYPKVAEIPFDSERKCMTSVHSWNGGVISFTNGAIDVLLDHSRHVLTADGVQPIDLAEISRTNERMAAEGLRVLGVAMRRWDGLPSRMTPDDVETGLTFIGLVGIMDPPREEAREAVVVCKLAGIKPAIITGDHPITARAIAMRVGIL